MANLEKPCMSKDSLKFLGDAKKGKIRNFVMVIKGTKVLNVVIYKTGSIEKHKLEAMTAGRGQFCHGVITGEGVNLQFQLARADGFEEAPTTNVALKKFLIENTNKNYKATYEIVDELQVVLDTEDSVSEPPLSSEPKVSAATSKVPPPLTIDDRLKKQKLKDALPKLIKRAKKALKSPDVPETVKSELRALISQCASDIESNQLDQATKAIAQLVGIFKANTPPDKDQQILAVNSEVDRIMPIVKRAIACGGKNKHIMESLEIEIKSGSVKSTPGQLLDKLHSLESLAAKDISEMDIQSEIEKQKDKLPVPSSELSKGRYIAGGNFGDTYILQTSTDESLRLAGKILRAPSQDALEDIEHEQEILARVGDHPNIVRGFGIHEIGGETCLVTEAIDGGTLNGVFDTLDKQYNAGTIDRGQYMGAMQHLIRGTLQGLALFESLGLTHFDAKGDNILFDRTTGEAKLIDFGLSQDRSARVDKAMPLKWAAPEALMRAAATVSSDSYALGQTIHQQTERVKDPDNPWKVGEIGSDVDRGQINVPGKGAADFNAIRNEPYLSQVDGAEKGMGSVPIAVSENADGTGQSPIDSTYVDFLNQLMHSDPEKRLSPSEALRHPFLADRLLDDEAAKALLQQVTTPPAPDEPRDEELENLRAQIEKREIQFKQQFTRTDIDESGGDGEDKATEIKATEIRKKLKQLHALAHPDAPLEEATPLLREIDQLFVVESTYS